MATIPPRSRRRFVLVAALCGVVAVGLAGCGTTSFNARAVEYRGSAPITSVYVYSFLDLQEGRLGKKFLAQVNRQLPIALAAHGVQCRQLWFNASPLAAQFTIEGARSGPSTQSRVPIADIIKANQQDEAGSGASYRLVMFPSFVISGGGEHFTIRWTLVDIRTDAVVWAASSSSAFANLVMHDENAEERARTFVAALITEWKSARVL